MTDTERQLLYAELLYAQDKYFALVSPLVTRDDSAKHREVMLLSSIIGTIELDLYGHVPIGHDEEIATHRYLLKLENELVPPSLRVYEDGSMLDNS